jgi:hypothetical protein
LFGTNTLQIEPATKEFLEWIDTLDLSKSAQYREKIIDSKVTLQKLRELLQDDETVFNRFLTEDLHFPVMDFSKVKKELKGTLFRVT